MLDYSDLWPFWACFWSLVASGVGFPIPEELPVVIAGAWAAVPSTIEKYGDYRWLMLPVCFLGVVVSDGFLYGIGRKFGRRLLQTRFFGKLLPPARRDEIEANFHKHGIKVLLFARFLPGIRSPVFIMAGVMKLPLRRFLIADAIYAIPGVSLLFFLAWWFGDQFVELVERFEEGVHAFIRPLLILVVLLGVIGWLVYKFLRHPVSTGDPADVPIVPQMTELSPIHKVMDLIEGKTDVKEEAPPPAEVPPPQLSPAKEGADAS